MPPTPKLVYRAATAIPPVRRLVTQREYLLGALGEKREQISQLETWAHGLQAQVQDLESRLHHLEGESIQFWPPGHFYSAVPSHQDIARFDSEYERS